MTNMLQKPKPSTDSLMSTHAATPLGQPVVQTADASTLLVNRLQAVEAKLNHLIQHLDPVVRPCGVPSAASRLAIPTEWWRLRDRGSQHVIEVDLQDGTKPFRIAGILKDDQYCDLPLLLMRSRQLYDIVIELLSMFRSGGYDSPGMTAVFIRSGVAQNPLLVPTFIEMLAAVDLAQGEQM
jgi:hypothetical protein